MTLAAARDLESPPHAPSAVAAPSVKNVHVILSDGDSADAAISLAHRFDARITALIVEEQAELSDYYDDARAAVRARVLAARDHFERLAAKRNVRSSVVDIAITPNRSYSEIARLCQFSDLVVVEQSAAVVVDGSRLLRRLLAEPTAPTLLLPRPGAKPFGYDRVAIAWDGLPATANAVRSALPILRLARCVSIVPMPGSHSRPPPGTGELARHLGMHGLEVDVVETGRGRSAIDIPLNAAKDPVDWVATGGRSRSRLRELFLGSPVLRMAAAASVPILLLR